MSLGELLSFLTLVVTVIGWSYTARKQSDLARRVREYQLRDREVQTFRSRLPLVGEMTSALTEAANVQMRLASLATFGFDIAQAGELSGELRKIMSRVLQIQNNPEFVRLRKQLPSEANEEVGRSINGIAIAQTRFFARFGDLHRENPAEHARLIAAMPEQALRLGSAYNVAAATVARAFAAQDTFLSAEGSEPGEIKSRD